MTASLRIVLWNIHRGKDFRHSPLPFPGGLRSLGPIDILCLVEADRDWPDCRGFLDLDAIRAATGLRRPDLHAMTLPSSHGFLGLLVLVSEKVSILSSRAFHLPSLHEPRGLLLQHLETTIGPISLGLTHLSLDLGLRCLQAGSIRSILRRESGMRNLALAGDFNEWAPLSPSLRILAPGLPQVRTPSFPSACPVLHLDRLVAWPGLGLRADRLPPGRYVPLSDHMPVSALLSRRKAP